MAIIKKNHEMEMGLVNIDRRGRQVCACSRRPGTCRRQARMKEHRSRPPRHRHYAEAPHGRRPRADRKHRWISDAAMRAAETSAIARTAEGGPRACGDKIAVAAEALHAVDKVA